MTDHYEMPHPYADACAHAGVGKACRPCREVLDNLHRISLRHTLAGRALMAEGWDAALDFLRHEAHIISRSEHHDAHMVNPYLETPNE